MEDIYEKAFSLLRSGDDHSVKQGLGTLRSLVERCPADSKARFEYAGGLDFLEREQEAIQQYSIVYENGLDELTTDDRMRLFAQMGSTLRNLGEYDRSSVILLEGLAKYPNSSALRVFLALTRYSQGRRPAALMLMAEALFDPNRDRSADEYHRAICDYIDNLD